MKSDFKTTPLLNMLGAVGDDYRGEWFVFIASLDNRAIHNALRKTLKVIESNIGRHIRRINKEV